MLILRKIGGFSLLELLISIAIFTLLFVMGAPSFSQWIQNTQNRTAAESILNGLQLARTEAVRHNAPVRFDLTDGIGNVTWQVTCVTVTDNCPGGNLYQRSASDGSINARAGIATATGALGTALSAGTGLPDGVTFDGLGRVVTANIGADIARVDITNAARTDARRMTILIGAGGQVRMCDPMLYIASSPQGCQ